MAATEGLLPGFRFHPTDEELVGYYLKRKNHGLRIDPDIIPVVHLYKCEPSDLPGKSFMPSTDRPEWYLFGPRDKKYPNGSKTNRATPKGHWKSTGNDRPVLQHNGGGGGGRAIVGMKKTLVYHEGRAPKGVRTDWVMNEYRLCDDSTAAMQVSSYALCRLLNKKAICTRTQVGMLPSSGSEGIPLPSSPPPPPELTAAVADGDTDKGNVEDWSWTDDQLNSFDDDSWTDYFLSDDAGCSGAAPVDDVVFIAEEKESRACVSRDG